jgi:hypothetical protein
VLGFGEKELDTRPVSNPGNLCIKFKREIK